VNAANQRHIRPWTAHGNGNGDGHASAHKASTRKLALQKRQSFWSGQKKPLITSQSADVLMVPSRTDASDTKRSVMTSTAINDDPILKSKDDNKTATTAAALVSGRRRERGGGGGGRVGTRHTSQLSSEPDVPLYRIAQNDPKSNLITRKKVKAMIDEFGQFPGTRHPTPPPHGPPPCSTNSFHSLITTYCDMYR
jgi:hypothetical protein